MSAVEIECPVMGVWSFMNPPGHHPDAKDFVAVDEKGKPYEPPSFARHVLWTLDVVDTFSWERQVLAPFDGEVVEVSDCCEDRKTLNLIRDVIIALLTAPRHRANDATFFLGNHIIMRSQKGVYALFAHLRKGSATVMAGERVEAGQILAAIGNSGNTIQPHLHFQLMDENAPFTATPLPFVFSRYERRQDGSWICERSVLPKNHQVFRTTHAA